MIILLLIASAFFSASEMAFIASDWITLREWTNKKRKGAKLALKALHNLDKLLIITLVGNNLANVGISVIAGSIWKEELPEPVIILLIGLLIFVCGEVFPKAIALRAKEQISILFVTSYKIIYYLLYPLIYIAYKTSISILRAFKITIPSSFQKFTREDLKIASERTLPLREHNIVSRLLDFRGRTAREIMIPKNRILAAPVQLSLTQLKQIVSQSGYSRIPIYQVNLDEIVGVVEAKSLLTATKLENIIKPCRFIDEAEPVESLLEELKEKKNFFAIVKDKHHRTLGLVTMEDILEELFGEIEDEYDKI